MNVVPIACYRRKRFPTEAAALTVAYRLRAKGADIGTELCEMCGQWHLKAARSTPRLPT